MKPLFAAIRFLTILPVPESWSGDEKDLGKSGKWFPVVGLLIGLFAAALDHGMGLLFPPTVTSVFAVIVLIGVSGGLHLDGLADTADGFFSSRPRERILEIMKDSRIGTMGAAAIMCVILLKVAALSAVPSALRLSTLLLAPMAGRSALVAVMSVLPYARPEGGLGSVFAQKSFFRLILAFIMLSAVGWLTAEWMGLTASAISLIVTLFFALHSYRKIGGFTGDILGASCEIIELVPILTITAWSYVTL